MPTTTSALARKLQLRPGYKITLVNAPPDMAEKLRPLPEHATVTTASAPRDAVIAFAKDQADLGKVAAQAIKAVKPDGLLWLAYPKGTAKVKTDLNRDVLWQIVEERHGLEGVTLVAVDQTWSAMRFRPRGAGKTGR
jgi:hypothetical protein